jgi:photosystem II stability/assembly factor-like uncharacterized protein
MIGPEGGNVRSLAYDPSNPNHILLGTSAGQLFSSENDGESWTLFAHFHLADDYVFDHIVFDPSNPATIYVAGWGLFNDTEGGVFRSNDGGKTWKELPGAHGKSIRAFAMAASDHNILTIGALDGVFRSKDGGATWQQITPENPEIMENHSTMRNFVSVAVDPENPDVVYAGTRHLAWKTSNAGASWHNIKDGMLDDSDVFSIIIDPKIPSRIYASACSGIYRSNNGGELFQRVQGLPHSAIRTRVLKQDPQRSSIVYAGTTGGLWKTLDGGAKWALVTSPDVIVNDVLIDPRNPDRVLVATDLRGVLVSNDGFAHYRASNHGFSHRVVTDVLADRQDAGRLYVGVANDGEMGGVFISDDAGKSWRQSSRGLEGRDVLSLEQAENGELFAGTNHGLFHLTSLGGGWQPAVMIDGPLPPPQPKEETPAPSSKSSKSKSAQSKPAHTSSAHKAASATKLKTPPEPVIAAADAPRVRSLQLGKDVWFAATSAGLFVSLDKGKKWYVQPVDGVANFIGVKSYGDGTVTLASNKAVYLSHDWGKTWDSVVLPTYIGSVYSFNLVPDSSLWVTSHEGAVRSSDGGKTWKYMLNGLPGNDVLTIEYDPSGQRLLATVLQQKEVFVSKDWGQSWQRTDSAAVSIHMVMNYQGHLLATTPHNGILLQESQSSSDAAKVATSSNATSQ